jgi:adenosylcobyric acid synthase
LRLTPGVDVIFVQPGEPIPASAWLVIIPGSKATMADLAALRREGWDIDIKAHVRRGGHVLGLCGGYQMLGRTISDPQGIEGPAGTVDGLGLLDVHTRLTADKSLTSVSATHNASGERFSGYEIHLGRTDGEDCARPFADIDGRPEGALSVDGRISGTYIHGCFGSDGFRQAFLQSLGAKPGKLDYAHSVDQALDRLAEHLAAHLDLNRLLSLAGPV